MNAVPKTDAEIIDEVRAGNTRSYAHLVDRHKDRALTLALRLVGARQEAEELVQDAFLKAFRNLGRFRGEARFGTWFYRILYNLCMTRLRRRTTAPQMLEISDETLLDGLPGEDDSIPIEEAFERSDLLGFLSVEMNSLPPQYKSAVTLYYVQELSYEEMAEVMDVPLGTVKTSLFRGRMLLRKRISTRLKKEVKVA
ncbi:MAG: sigW [Bacteroidetes bacterium]|nr:sigW [Bacteroidota bacterium]